VPQDVWQEHAKAVMFLISNIRRVLNVVFFILGRSPASEFYMPTFRNTLFHLHRRIDMKNDWVENGVYIREKVWLENSLSQTFSRINTPTFSAQLPSIPTRLRRWNRQSVPKRRHMKFRRRGITQKKAYNSNNVTIGLEKICRY
jgi:hypothetical protein